MDGNHAPSQELRGFSLPVHVDIRSSQMTLDDSTNLGCNLFFYLPDNHAVHSAVKGKALAGTFDMATEGSAWAIVLAVLNLMVVAGP